MGIQTYNTEIDDLYMKENEARQKANSLSDQANKLQQIAQQSQSPAENAIQAASAYKNILDAMNSAEESAAQAEKDSNAAAEMSVGVYEKAEDRLKTINELYNGASGAIDASNTVRMTLSPDLKESKEKVDRLTSDHKIIKQDLETINKQLDSMGDLSET